MVAVLRSGWKGEQQKWQANKQSRFGEKDRMKR